MKKLLALVLAAVMLLTLAACGQEKNEGGNSAPQANLETFEVTVEPSGVEEPAKVSVGYPKNFTMEEKDWCVVLTDQQKDVEIEVYISAEYDCYAVNEEYAKEEYFYYKSGTFGSYNGYVCRQDEASADVEVYVYMGCVAEMDDVYMTFYIGSASMDLEADPMALYELEEVQQVLKSLVYTAPAA